MDRRTFISRIALGLGLAASAPSLSAITSHKKKASKILIRNGIIIPMDGKHRTIRDQALLIADNQIAAIGDPGKLMKEHDIDRIIDASGQAVLPGLVNAHTHVATSSILRGLAEDVTEEQYSELAIPLEQQILKEEDFQLFAQLGTIELLKFGNTCANELGLVSMEATALAFEETGIRGVLAPDVSDILEGGDGQPDPQLKDQRFTEAVRLLNKWHTNDDSILTVRIANYAPMLCSPETLMESKALAKKYRTGLNAHANMGEWEYFKEKYKKTQMEHLAEMGYLDENTTLVHMTATVEEEIAPLKESGAWVVHCPFEIAKRGSSAPVNMMYEADLNVALGSDWLMFDPFEQMRHAVVMARLDSGDMGILKAYDFLEMATIKAANAVGLGDQIGSLEIGKKADIILVDYDQAHISPMNRHYDLVTNLVYNAHGSDVTTVIVDGNIVVESGEIRTVDGDKVVREANKRAEAALTKRFSL